MPRILNRDEKRTSDIDMGSGSVDSVRAQLALVCEVATRRFSMKRDMVTALRLPVGVSDVEGETGEGILARLLLRSASSVPGKPSSSVYRSS